MQINKYTRGDSKSLDEIYNISENELSVTKNGLKDWIDSEYSMTILLLEQGKIIGYSIFQFTDTNMVDLLYIYINKENRGKGYSVTLLTSSMFMLKSKNVREITLEVSVNNHIAIKLYNNLGFQIISTRPKYYKDGSDALIMKIYY